MLLSALAIGGCFLKFFMSLDQNGNVPGTLEIATALEAHGQAQMPQPAAPQPQAAAAAPANMKGPKKAKAEAAAAGVSCAQPIYQRPLEAVE